MSSGNMTCPTVRVNLETVRRSIARWSRIARRPFANDQARRLGIVRCESFEERVRERLSENLTV